jgi:hypothetical protein
MASTTTIGGQTLPLPAGVAGGFLRGYVAEALLDFLAFNLNWALNAKLAQMTPKVAQAVPTANRFPYDPADLWPQRPVPALYVWWQGSRKTPHSTLRERVESDYGFRYIAQPITAPMGSMHFSGLGETVDRIIRYAADQGYHSQYGYNGAPPGEMLNLSLGFQGWEVAESKPGIMRPVAGQAGAAPHYYPAVEGTLRCWTVIEQREADGPTGGAGPGAPGTPGDALGDITAGFYTNGDGDVNNAVLFMDRVLASPDGAENK